MGVSEQGCCAPSLSRGVTERLPLDLQEEGGVRVASVVQLPPFLEEGRKSSGQAVWAG